MLNFDLKAVPNEMNESNRFIRIPVQVQKIRNTRLGMIALDAVVSRKGFLNSNRVQIPG